MTVIAYDKKTLVADKQATLGNMKFAVTKISKIGDWAVGFAGTASDGLKFVEWFKGINSKAKVKPDYPFDSESDADFQVLCINTKTKEVWYYDDTSQGTHIKVEQDYFAIGSGATFAITSMFLNKTAKEAVEITSVLCPDCGEGLDVIELS